MHLGVVHIKHFADTFLPSVSVELTRKKVPSKMIGRRAWLSVWVGIGSVVSWVAILVI